MISCKNLGMSYGGRTLFRGADVLVRPGDRIGLVGPNGAGKTTLFRLLAGEEDPDEGDVTIEPGVVVGYFSQDVGELSGRSALLETISGAGRVYGLGSELSELEHRMSTGEALDDRTMERYGEIQAEFMHLGGYELEQKAEAILAGLGIEAERQGNPVETFSGGWKMRIALAKILLLEPDVLLIDEPTNHLDIESIVWLESWLQSFRGALVMTSHDREFMTRICSRTVEVAAGAVTCYSGDYDFYLREREIRRAQLVATAKRQEAMLAKEEAFIARFAARASHAAQVQSRVKTIEKIERVEVPPDPKVIKFRWKAPARSGDVVLEMKDLGKSWTREDGSALRVFSGLSGTVTRGNKIALTGVNGAGKSTLLKVIAGMTDPSEGSCALGAGVSVGYFSQYSGDVLSKGKTVFEELAERMPGESDGTIRNLAGAFQFSKDDADKRIGVLSGGEKTRVMLACLLASPSNFLVLDEPTNHLDIASRETLLEALGDFGGTVIIVSHDRYFLKHLATRVFEIDHGALRAFEGDYRYYLDKRASL